MTLQKIAIPACAALLSCASPPASGDLDFAERISQTGRIEVTGWLRVRGEALIYSDQNHMRARSHYPYCVSGVLEHHDPSMISQYDNQPVTVIGELFSYDLLPDEDSPLIPRKTLRGSVVSNFCNGKNVILIEFIEPAR